MTLPPGFKVTLFAGEPDVAQPIGFTTDDRGRLWVAECYSYPNWKAEGHDRILVFSDPRDTGRFAERKVFWDHANNLTGLEVGFGGVWLCMPPKMVFIPRSGDGDAAPIEPQTVLDGWSLQGRHNIVNGLTWGPDGWLYGCNGISSPSRVAAPGTPDSQRQAISGGVWRWHPVKHRFEVVARGTTNPWGLDFDDFGEAFITNCVIGHLWHVIPGAHFKRMHGVDENPYSFELLDATSDHLHWGGGDWTTSRGGQGIHSEAGGGHSHAGAMVYLGDNWPEQYRNTIFMCNIHGNRVNNDLLQRNGSGYVGKHGKDFLLAGDSWFRGLNLKYGPDGGVYLSDWSDNGECHNVAQTDRGSGRIFKIVYREPTPTPADLDLNKLSDAELVALQRHNNDWYVRHARRILQERAAAGRDMTAVRRSLLVMFEQERETPKKLRALWALHVTGNADENFLLRQLLHCSENIRAWAIRLLCEDNAPSQAVRSEFARLAKDDPSACVRLSLASALQRMPLDQRWAIAGPLAAHSEDAADPSLPLMIWYGIEPAVGKDPQAGLQLALECKLAKVRRFIARRVLSNCRPKAIEIAWSWWRDTSSKPSTRPSNSICSPACTTRCAADAWCGRPPAGPRFYARLSRGTGGNGAGGDGAAGEVQSESHALALIFGDAKARESMQRTVADRAEQIDRRRRALDALIEAQAVGMPGILQNLLDDSALGSRAIQGLAAYDDPKTPAALLARYGDFSLEQKRDAVNTLTSRAPYALALLQAIERKQIPAADLAVTGARQLRQFKNKQLDELLAKVWGSLRESPADKQQELARYKALLSPEFIARGNVAAGRSLFAKTCGQCHTLYGSGGKVGPDLTGSNRANVDYVLQKLVDPSAAVPNDFRMQLVWRKDGRLIAGIVREQTPAAIVLQTAAERITIPTDDIDIQKPSGISMMPERQLNTLEPEQLRDLFRYLTSRNPPEG